ncbi:unnamed protein product [Amoebophrya sp. A25]|nr:unnamed protein product [Amoebophrya sp. A25]|eukprot:GSA25T00004355001.1
MMSGKMVHLVPFCRLLAPRCCTLHLLWAFSIATLAGADPRTSAEIPDVDTNKGSPSNRPDIAHFLDQQGGDNQASPQTQQRQAEFVVEETRRPEPTPRRPLSPSFIDKSADDSSFSTSNPGKSSNIANKNVWLPLDATPSCNSRYTATAPHQSWHDCHKCCTEWMRDGSPGIDKGESFEEIRSISNSLPPNGTYTGLIDRAYLKCGKDPDPANQADTNNYCQVAAQLRCCPVAAEENVVDTRYEDGLYPGYRWHRCKCNSENRTDIFENRTDVCEFNSTDAPPAINSNTNPQDFWMVTNWPEDKEFFDRHHIDDLGRAFHYYDKERGPRLRRQLSLQDPRPDSYCPAPTKGAP